MTIKASKKGVAVFLAMLIMAILLAIGLGVSTILLGQTRMVKGMGDSVVAFYAADTGMETVLFGISTNVSQSATSGQIGDASYEARLVCAADYTECPSPLATDVNCTSAIGAQYYCAKSVGIFKGIRRAIEVTR